MAKNKIPVIGGIIALALAGSIIGLGMVKPYSTDPLPPRATQEADSNAALRGQKQQPSGAVPQTAAAGLPAAAKDLPPDVLDLLAKQPADVQKKLLEDPLFHDYMQDKRPAARAKFFGGWLDGLQDNFCRESLDAVARRAYDADGIKKLNLKAAQASCPRNVSLEKTLDYVNGKLADAFDDPYTAIMPPALAAKTQSSLDGTAHIDGGVGLLFTVSHSRTLPAAPKSNPGLGAEQQQPGEPHFEFTGLIYHVASNSPAAAAGLQDGDILLKAVNENLIGQDFDHVINDVLIGKAGSTVKLTVKRGEQEFERTVTRGKVTPDSVWTRNLGDGYYSIIVSKWSENVSGQILGTMLNLQAQGAKGFVLDLRFDGGGLFEEAILAVSYAVEDGVLVTTRERVQDNGDPEQPHYQTVTWERRHGQLIRTTKDEATGKVEEQRLQVAISATNKQTGEVQNTKGDVPLVKNLPPMVVLGNGGTASASEIAYGGLTKNKVLDRKNKKYQGATSGGEPTFGKGIEQENGPGAMKTRLSATMGRYFLKDGTWPGDAHKNRHPLQPELLVEQPQDAMLYTESDKQMNTAKDFLVHSQPE